MTSDVDGRRGGREAQEEERREVHVGLRVVEVVWCDGDKLERGGAGGDGGSKQNRPEGGKAPGFILVLDQVVHPTTSLAS